MDNTFKNIGASNHTKAERETLDFYATDSRAIGHLFAKAPWLINYNSIVEPCAGDGTMADQIALLTSKDVDKYDIVSRREDISEADYFNLDIKNKYDLIITNPPYLRETKNKPGLTTIICKMLDEIKPGGAVCLFLKLIHLESQDRYSKIFKTMPPKFIYVYAPRISCYKNNNDIKQDAIAYAWYIWRKEEDGTFTNEMPRIGWISEL